MVCDIVEKPARNAAMLKEEWIWRGHCREAVVNLEVADETALRRSEAPAAGADRRRLQGAGHQGRDWLKQLYHDREESISTFAMTGCEEARPADQINLCVRA